MAMAQWVASKIEKMIELTIKTEKMIKLALRSISLGVAMVFFYLSSFYKEQFEKDDIPLKIVVIIALSVFAVVITINAQKLKDTVDRIEKWPTYLKAMVRFVMLALSSVVIFLTKYPRFRTNVPKTSQTMIFGSRCYLFSVAAFSAHSLLLSCDGNQTTKLGISDFFLAMTIEASMGIIDNNGMPNLWYIVGASAYCFLLILYKSSWSRHSTTDHSSIDIETRVADRRSGHIRADLSDNTSSMTESNTITYEGDQQNNDGHPQISTNGPRRRSFKLACLIVLSTMRFKGLIFQALLGARAHTYSDSTRTYTGRTLEV